MEKSYNDIKAQEKRVIETAKALGKFCDNKNHSVDIQRIAQITRNALCQHGIGFFGYDPDEKKPRRPIEKTEPKHEPVKEEEPEPVKVTAKTPTERADDRMALHDWMAADENNRRKIQELARHQYMNRMYAELLFDMQVCRMEGWDVFEYPRMIRDAVTKLLPQAKQLTLQFT